MSESSTICFVCTANICRSAFAAAYAKSQFDKHGLKSVAITSAGVQASHGYSPAAAMVEVAEEFEVAMADHRSRPLSPELMNEARFILVMEKFHLQEVELRFPETKGRVFLLRNFAERGERNRDITDPVGLSPDFMRVCFDDIAEAIDGLLNRLQKDEKKI